MGKRKSEPAGLFDPAVSMETIPPADELPPESAPSAEVPFTMASWKGLTQWRCRRCPWDTLAGEEALLAHVQEVHEPPLRPPSPPLVAIANRWGREVAPAAEPEPARAQDRDPHPAEEE